VRVSRFRIYARLEMASRATHGTVMIARKEDLFSVRPLRRRRIYSLPLSVVAQMVVRSIIATEVREKAKAKRAKRGGRRR